MDNKVNKLIRDGKISIDPKAAEVIDNMNFEAKLLKSAGQAVEITVLEAAWEYAAKLRKQLTEVEQANEILYIAGVALNIEKDELLGEISELKRENTDLRQAFRDKGRCNTCDHAIEVGNCNGCNLADIDKWLDIIRGRKNL